VSVVSAGDGPRSTIPGMASKMRPGSISSGPGKGKFPITTQKSVSSAASLLHNAKGVSRARIIAHVRAAAKARGLKLTPAFQTPGSKTSTDKVSPKAPTGWTPPFPGAAPPFKKGNKASK
jgi:hypothetical protein